MSGVYMLRGRRAGQGALRGVGAAVCMCFHSLPVISGSLGCSSPPSFSSPPHQLIRSWTLTPGCDQGPLRCTLLHTSSPSTFLLTHPPILPRQPTQMSAACRTQCCDWDGLGGEGLGHALLEPACGQGDSPWPYSRPRVRQWTSPESAPGAPAVGLSLVMTTGIGRVKGLEGKPVKFSGRWRWWKGSLREGAGLEGADAFAGVRGREVLEGRGDSFDPWVSSKAWLRKLGVSTGPSVSGLLIPHLLALRMLFPLPEMPFLRCLPGELLFMAQDQCRTAFSGGKREQRCQLPCQSSPPVSLY